MAAGRRARARREQPPTTGAGPVRPAAELAVAGLSVVTVLTSWRLFAGWSWLPVLVCAALLSHLIGALTRRAGWSALASLGVLAGRPRSLFVAARPVPRHHASSGCRRWPRGRPRSSSSAPPGTSSRPPSPPSSPHRRLHHRGDPARLAAGLRRGRLRPSRRGADRGRRAVRRAVHRRHRARRRPPPPGWPPPSGWRPPR